MPTYKKWMDLNVNHKIKKTSLVHCVMKFKWLWPPVLMTGNYRIMLMPLLRIYVSAGSAGQKKYWPPIFSLFQSHYLWYTACFLYPLQIQMAIKFWVLTCFANCGELGRNKMGKPVEYTGWKIDWKETEMYTKNEYY